MKNQNNIVRSLKSSFFLLFFHNTPPNSDLYEQAECLSELLHYTTPQPKKQPPLSSNCRPDCAITALYQFRILTPMMIESITLERERE